MAATEVRHRQSTSGLGVASNGTSAVTLVSLGSDLVGPDALTGPGGIVVHVRIYNADTVAHRVELHLVPTGDGSDFDTLFYNETLQAGQVDHLSVPERAPASASIQVVLGEAHTTRAVRVKVDVSEIYA